MALLLNRSALEAALDLDQVIEAVAAGFAAYSRGETEAPPRIALAPPGNGGVLLTMPCAMVDPPALGAKLVSVFPANRQRGLPTVTSLYVLLDRETGAPLAVMDGAHLTAFRTAAGSAVATRELAPAGARTLGVFGTGVQAWHHVQMISRVRQITQLLVAGTSPDKEAGFAARVEAEFGLQARGASPEEVSAADVVAACTTSTVPVVVADRVRQGSHVNAVGAFTPQTRELPSALVARTAVYVDTRTGAAAEAGDLLIPASEGVFTLDAVRGELGEVLLGRVTGRRDSHEVTVYKSVGAAFLDAATAHLAYQRAKAAGLGHPFEFS